LLDLAHRGERAGLVALAQGGNRVKVDLEPRPVLELDIQRARQPQRALDAKLGTRSRCRWTAAPIGRRAAAQAARSRDSARVRLTALESGSGQRLRVGRVEGLHAGLASP
jgi:hypothetical protein